MNTELRLGPSIEVVVEPEPPSEAPGPPQGYRWVEFDVPATEIGGVVHVRFTAPQSPSDKAPINIYACYVSPHDSVPPKDQRDPSWFFAAHDKITKAIAHTSVGDPDNPPQKTIRVPGVKPGAHFLQTILEYPV